MENEKIANNLNILINKSYTPYQIAIKEALELESDIQYGHLPIIIDTNGKKLSKY